MNSKRKAHILLAEDYKANVLIATALLEEFGYDYTVASNGQEALQLIQNQPFDLVLMDVQMPGIGGIEATQLTREWEKSQHKVHLPIIGITAHALKGDRERFVAAGMDDYISKPFHPDEFKSKLEKYLGVAS